MMITRNKVQPIFERAVKTFFQTFLAVIGVDAVAVIWELDWTYALGVSATAALLSVASSVASWKVGENRGPSLTSEAAQ